MTTEEFSKLSTEEQEFFINSGGLLSQVPVPDVTTNTQDKSNTGTNIPQPVTLSSTEATHSPPVDEQKSGDSSNGEEAISSLQTSEIVFDFEDPVEMLLLLDDSIRNGKVTLHDWQIQWLLDFAKSGQSDSRPFQSVVRACNGSGKDKYLIAPAAVWLCMKHKKARAVVTSSSGVQLDNQTCSYIEHLCNSANAKFGGKVWKVNYRYYECLASESPIVCYATDEPGKAEGFHPFEYGAKMGIFVSEDKSVPDEINIALNKCTGYTHRAHVSTPGNAFGHFFDYCSTAIDRKSIKSAEEVKPEDWIQYHVTAFDCPHLSTAYINQMKRDLPGGENGPAYKSQVLAEFCTTDEMVVIPYTYIWQAKRMSDEKWVPETYNKAGLDLSDGGDETVLIVRNGNKVMNIIPFRFDNTEDTVEFLQEKFTEHKLVHPEALIFADCGGIGKPILDRLKRLGWSNIRYCDNRAKSLRPKTYKNWGAESWFNFGTLLKQREIILPDDGILTKQLSTRYYKIIDGAVHQLLSKIEMRSRGYPSPDRADACVLAFADYKSDFVAKADAKKEKPFEVEEKDKTQVKSEFSLRGSIQGKKDYKRTYRVNGGQKDFSDLQEEIAELNKQLITKGK